MVKRFFMLLTACFLLIFPLAAYADAIAPPPDAGEPWFFVIIPIGVLLAWTVALIREEIEKREMNESLATVVDVTATKQQTKKRMTFFKLLFPLILGACFLYESSWVNWDRYYYSSRLFSARISLLAAFIIFSTIYLLPLCLRFFYYRRPLFSRTEKFIITAIDFGIWLCLVLFLKLDLTEWFKDTVSPFYECIVFFLLIIMLVNTCVVCFTILGYECPKKIYMPDVIADLTACGLLFLTYIVFCVFFYGYLFEKLIKYNVLLQ